jgi:predicted DNA-binding protein
MTEKLKRTTIFLTEEQQERLRQIAFEKQTSMAGLVREAIMEILEEEEDAGDIKVFDERAGDTLVSYDEMVKKMEENSR